MAVLGFNSTWKTILALSRGAIVDFATAPATAPLNRLDRTCFFLRELTLSILVYNYSHTIRCG